MKAQAKPAAYGLTSLTALVIANMIGAGVFTTSGFALADLYTPERVLLAWAVAGGIALCGAYAYGALADVLTESGGEYLYLSRLVHPAVGFIAGWVSLLAGFTGAIAFAALSTIMRMLSISMRAFAIVSTLRPSIAIGFPKPLRERPRFDISSMARSAAPIDRRPAAARSTLPWPIGRLGRC